ncbi:MAG: hypothetical protein LBS33_00615 [Streptococcaceae bacterium]|nr:hypothetical protein [Streptococcaceae bacterium]
MEKAVALDSLFYKMKSEDQNVEHNALVSKVNLSKSHVSELLIISHLEQNIKNGAIKSNNWSHARLLKLAQTVNPEKRMDKFDEFKKLIENKKKQSKNDDVEVTQPTAANNVEVQRSLENEAQNQIINNKIIRFQAHMNTFKTKLLKFKKLNKDPDSIEKVRPDLSQIVDLINEILN